MLEAEQLGRTVVYFSTSACASPLHSAHSKFLGLVVHLEGEEGQAGGDGGEEEGDGQDDGGEPATSCSSRGLSCRK